MSQGRLAVGVDVGGTSIKFGAVRDDDTVVVERLTLPTDAEQGVERVFARIAEGVNHLLELLPDRVTAVGLGVPGVANPRGEISYPPNFPGWEVVPVADRLRPLLKADVPIAVENDANVAAFAEARAPGCTDRDFLFVTLGTGVGGCIISDGQIWRGATGGAGEVGHISIDLNGHLCNCGSRGCIEAYLGQRYLTAHAAQRLVRFPESLLNDMMRDGAELDPRLINHAAESGDRFSQDFLREMGEILGGGLASALNLCDLHLVIVGGGMAGAERWLIDPARRALRGRLLKSVSHDVELRAARYQNDAGIIGAALLGLEAAG